MVSISIVRQQPRVLGLVVELLTRRRIFVPILRVTAIEPNAVTLNTGNVSLRRFAQRPGEVLVLGQVLETHVRVNDPNCRSWPPRTSSWSTSASSRSERATGW